MKPKLLQSLFFLYFFIPENGFSQINDNNKTFSTIICEYTLPINRNGLSVTSFHVTPKIRIERWEKEAKIILEISKKQGTPANPNPSFYYSYNYNGKKYGDGTLGRNIYSNIKAENLTYEVLVTYGSKSWGWQKVDGMTNQFGPIDLKAKASEVNVSVRVVNLSFSGTSMIENRIREMLRSGSGNSIETSNEKTSNTPTTNGSDTSVQKKSEEKTKTLKEDVVAKNDQTAERTSSVNKISTTSGSVADENSTKSTDSQTDKSRAKLESRELAEREEAERKRQEEDAKVSRQKTYDEWKANKKDEQAKIDAASVAASFSMAYLIGGIIYEGMDHVNPDYVFKPGSNLRLHLGLDFGFSGLIYPTLFASDKSTMINGESSAKKELIPRNIYHLNLNVKVKIGAEHPLYGFYGYLAPQVGMSPVLDGYNFTPLNVGGHAFAGINWVKGFIDYGIGTRFFSVSSNDAEESGSGKTDINYEKLTYGLKFTTKADANFRRSHIIIGMINEKISVAYQQAFVDPTLGYLVKEGKSKTIKAYTFQWKKDHKFNFYVNAYPNYLYAGDNETTPAGLSSDFSTKKSNLFLEIGFLRSIDFW